MPEKNTKEAMMCSCANCQGYGMYGHKHFWLRWILAIVIILIVFALGVKIGEFRAMFDPEGFGPGMYGHHGDMMYGNDGYFLRPVPTTQSTTPAPTTTTPSTKK